MAEYVTYGGAKKTHSKKRGAGSIMGGEIMGGSIIGGAILGGADLMKRHHMGMGVMSAGEIMGGAKKHRMPHVRGRGVVSAGVVSAGVVSAGGSPAQMKARELFKRRVEYIMKHGMSTRDKSAWAKAKMHVK